MLTAKVSYWAIGVAAVAALVVSSVWYIALGDVYLELLQGIDSPAAQADPSVAAAVGQVVRNLVVASALAYLLRRLQVGTWAGALGVGLVVWLGFQAMAVLGSVLHEQYPLGLYAIHVGDALATTLAMALILGAWQRRPASPGVQR
jgi:Protein of unknown function (DUF1761)